jgi:hypothetical protein
MQFALHLAHGAGMTAAWHPAAWQLPSRWLTSSQQCVQHAQAHINPDSSHCHDDLQGQHEAACNCLMGNMMKPLAMLRFACRACFKVAVHAYNTRLM